jgi:hypothetical protein
MVLSTYGLLRARQGRQSRSADIVVDDVGSATAEGRGTR